MGSVSRESGDGSIPLEGRRVRKLDVRGWSIFSRNPTNVVRVPSAARLPARMPGPKLAREASLAVLLLLLGAGTGAGCCVAPPTTGELLAVGFHTPEQAFATFQTAVRADDPSLERRCLSADFVARNHLSEQVFRVFWEQLEEDEPFLRKGIADAERSGPAEVRRDRATLRAESHGKKIVVELVREDFSEAFSGDERLVDEAAPFAERTGVQPAADGTSWIYGRMPLPSGIAPERVTELRLGREWKIDGFRVDEGKAGAPKGEPIP
jgi:hypothetical protein